MLKLGRLQLQNPIIASAGACGFGRGYWWEKPYYCFGLIQAEKLGAVITKTLTLLPYRGNWRGWNPWQVLWPIRHGWINSIGLSNPGVEWFIRHAYQHAWSNNLIVSITDQSADAIVEITRRLNETDIMGIEINLSCPNTSGRIDWQHSPSQTREMLEKVRVVSQHPVVIKIGYLAKCDERHLLAEIFTDCGIDAVDMINSVPFSALFPGKKSPLEKGGGVSGRLIKKLALEQVKWFNRNTSLPIIGGGGASSPKDVRDFLQAGARAVSIGSAHILRPWISTGLTRIKFCDRLLC